MDNGKRKMDNEEKEFNSKPKLKYAFHFPLSVFRFPFSDVFSYSLVNYEI